MSRNNIKAWRFHTSLLLVCVADASICTKKGAWPPPAAGARRFISPHVS